MTKADGWLQMTRLAFETEGASPYQLPTPPAVKAAWLARDHLWRRMPVRPFAHTDGMRSVPDQVNPFRPTPMP